MVERLGTLWAQHDRLPVGIGLSYFYGERYGTSALGLKISYPKPANRTALAAYAGRRSRAPIPVPAPTRGGAGDSGDWHIPPTIGGVLQWATVWSERVAAIVR